MGLGDMKVLQILGFVMTTGNQLEYDSLRPRQSWFFDSCTILSKGYDILDQ